MTRTDRPASARLRAADNPARPAPTTRTDLVSAGGGSPDAWPVARDGCFDAQAAATPAPTTPVVAEKNSRRDNHDTGVSVS
jgi:hypothetical protein